MRGRVELGTSGNPENVYVWLDGFDIGTRADARGFFELTLPPPDLQSTSGVTGGFTLYYFVGNFTLEKARLLVRGGELVSSGELNRLQDVIETKRLLQTLRISTEVSPVTVALSEIAVVAGKSDVLVSVNVTLQAVRDSVEVLFPGKVGSLFGPLFFRNVDTGAVTILSSTVASPVDRDLVSVGAQEEIRVMVRPLLPEDLLPGFYEVIPYVLVTNPDLPPGLIRSLGVVIEEFGPDYVRIPFQREGQSRFFRVTP